MSSSDCKEVNLGKITKIKGRIGWKGYKTSDLREYGPVVLGGNNIKNSIYLDLRDVKHLTRDKYEESPEIMLKQNDILVVTRGNGIGDVSYFNGSLKEATINPSMVILSNCTENPKFIFYYLISPIGREHILSVSSGSSIPAIYQKSLATVKCIIPTLLEQKAIADTLSCLDDKIELNNRINKTLEEMAQAIFKSWFVDFEPFQDGEFEESELGRIPKGWRLGTLGDILDNIKNQEKAGPHIKDMPYVPIDSIPMKCLGLSDFKPGEGAQSSLVRFLKNDVLIGAMRVYFHRVVLAPFDGITRTTCFVLRPKQLYLISYALLLCNLDNTIEYAQKTSKGSTMPYAIWDGGLKDLKIIIPEEKTIDHFNEVVFPLLKQVRDGLFENKTLNYIRDSLLPKLMSGEIRVPIEEVQ